MLILIDTSAALGMTVKFVDDWMWVAEWAQ
jgi:hypothetical protein